jgi:hypothetical protein
VTERNFSKCSISAICSGTILPQIFGLLKQIMVSPTLLVPKFYVRDAVQYQFVSCEQSSTFLCVILDKMTCGCYMFIRR